MKNKHRHFLATLGMWLGRCVIKRRAVVFAIMMCCCAVQSACSECISVRHGTRDVKKMAITVDDCYSAERVRQIFELCQRYGVKITYFVLGNAISADDAALWQSIVSDGFEIGIHSYEHKTLSTMPASEVVRQMQRTQEKVDEVLGYHYPMRIMRPPYGSTNIGMEIALEKAGFLAVVRWDVSQTDAKKAFERAQNGSILLYHANLDDLLCLEELIPRLLDEEYELVTVSELLGLREE